MRKVFSLFIFMFFLSILSYPVLGQNNSLPGLAISVIIPQKNLKDGTIITYTSKGYKVASKEYDPDVYGIITTKAAISIDKENNTSSYLVSSNGIIYVRVTTINGAIKKDDWITTSSIPGVGMKATRAGYVIGSAQEAYAATNPKAEKLIPVSISFRHVAPKNALNSNLMDIFNLSALATYEQPLTVFKYLIAAALIIISFVAGFLVFGRVAGLGVQSIGRNPLASRKIEIGIIINTLITIVVIGAGLTLALTIIK